MGLIIVLSNIPVMSITIISFTIIALMIILTLVTFITTIMITASTESYMSGEKRLGITIVLPPKVPPPGFKELIRTIWGSIRPNRIRSLGGTFWGVLL